MALLQVGLFVVLLGSPLAAWPGFGYDGLRLPLQLLLGSILMGIRALDPPPDGRPDRILWAGLALLGVQILSLTAARSPWEGAFSIGVLAAGILGYGLARHGPVSPSWVRGVFPWVLTAVGLGLSLVGWAGDFWGEALSTEGNRNYDGDLAAMLLPATLGFVLEPRPAWKRGILALSAVALLGELFRSESRAGLVGAVLGCLVLAAVSHPKRGLRGSWVPAAAMFLLVGVPLLAQRGKHFSPERQETTSFRWEVWKSAWAMFRDRPFRGVGAGNLAVEYPAYRSDREFDLSNRYAPPGQFFELADPHSSWVQVAVESGLPGLGAFLLVILAIAGEARRSLRGANDAGQTAVRGGLAGGMTAYLVSGFFNTLTGHASHTLLFWVFAGFLGNLGDEPVPQGGRSSGLLGRAFSLLAALAALLGSWETWGIARAERATLQATHSAQARDKEELLDRALSLFPAGWRALFEKGNLMAKLGRFPASIEAYRDCLRWRPFHAVASNNLALSLLRMGRFDEAEALLLESSRQVPCFPLTYYNLGTLELERGRLGEARTWFGRSVERRPNHGPSHFSLGEAYLRQGEVSSALPHLRHARDLGFDVAGALRRDDPALAGDDRLGEFFR